MTGKTETYATRQQSQTADAVEIEIKEHPDEHEEEHGDFLALHGAPFETGKKNEEGSHDILLRNFTPHRLRFCFTARDKKPIADYFKTPINTKPGDYVGSVQLEPPASGAPFREYKMELTDGAFDTPGGSPKKRNVGISATKLSLGGPCVFEQGEDPSPDDIVIDAGN